MTSPTVIPELPEVPADVELGGVRESWRPMPVEPMRELRWELGDGWDGKLPIRKPWVDGCRVKLVVLVPQDRAAEVDADYLRSRAWAKGAKYCKVEVHVLRRAEVRDERHAPEVDLRTSLQLFAEEIRTRNADAKIAAAEALAREADEGVEE